jgi:hypothetical protein
MSCTSSIAARWSWRSTRKLSNPFDEDAVVFVVGGKDGYVERDGHLVDAADAERRASFGKS